MYTVVRPTGLTDEMEGGPFALEADQGDRISGKVARAEVVGVIRDILGSDVANNRTFELRRKDETDPLSKRVDAQSTTRMLLRTAEDRHRVRIGLPPFPPYVPPPPPVTAEKRQEILSRPDVQASIQGGRGARSRDPEEFKKDGVVPTMTNPDIPSASARAWIDAWRAKQGASAPAASGNGASAAAPAAGSEAAQWIANWRAKQGSGAASSGAESEAQRWINAWRAKQVAKV